MIAKAIKISDSKTVKIKKVDGEILSVPKADLIYARKNSEGNLEIMYITDSSMSFIGSLTGELTDGMLECTTPSGRLIINPSFQM